MYGGVVKITFACKAGFYRLFNQEVLYSLGFHDLSDQLDNPETFQF